MTNNFPPLTVEFIKNNIGKEITWHAYGYHANLPMKGVCKLLGVQETKEIDPSSKKPYMRPIIEHIKGDDLSFGWVEGDYITYSDSGRTVYIGSAFDLYNVKWDVQSHGFLRATGNPMTYSIVVYTGEDVQTKAQACTTAAEFDIEHIV